MKPNDELLSQLFSFMHLAGRYYHQNHQQGMAPQAALRGQGRLLHLLLAHDGVSQRELAELMQIRAASLNELVQKAEAKGTIRREPDPSDRRLSNVWLTEAGRALAQGLGDDSQPQEDIFAVLTPQERAQLAAILGKLNAHLREQAQEAMPRHRHRHNHPEHQQ